MKQLDYYVFFFTLKVNLKDLIRRQFCLLYSNVINVNCIVYKGAQALGDNLSNLQCGQYMRQSINQVKLVFKIMICCISMWVNKMACCLYNKYFFFFL